MNGLTLLAPAGLFALAALALPLLIHLFSRSRGRRVLVGNIALYRQARRRRVSEVRPVQWLLLLLRLALLALAALLLAGLARDGLDRLEGDTAYLTPEWLAWQQTRDDATRPAGVDRAFLLADGFPALDLVTLAPDGDAAVPARGPDAWSLLAERLATVDHAGEVQLFALAEAAQFPAEAPALADPIRWRLADRPGFDSPPPALTVRILSANGRERDAALVEAALVALSHHRRLDLEIGRRSTDDLPAGVDARRAREAGSGRGMVDAVIWLGAGPAPEFPDAEVVVEDRPAGTGAAVMVQVGGPTPVAFRSRPSAPGEGAVRWRALNGAPVLQQQQRGEQRRLVLLDRLGARDGLAAQAAFPDVLLGMLLGEAAWQHALSAAPADPAAAVARTAPAGDGPARPARPLAPWLALAMALLLGLERWLAERPGQPARPATDGDPA